MKSLPSKLWAAAPYLATIVAFAGVASPADAQGYWDRWSAPPPARAGHVDPMVRPYGPGAYSENGVHVYVPANCYVSREQVWRNGALMWRPVKTCPAPGYR